MSNITLYVPDNLKEQMNYYDEVKWSEVVRKSITEKITELRKLSLLKKYLDKEPFSSEDLAWMDEFDWHPVDEKELKRTLVTEIAQRSQRKSRKLDSVDSLFK